MKKLLLILFSIFYFGLSYGKGNFNTNLLINVSFDSSQSNIYSFKQKTSFDIFYKDIMKYIYLQKGDLLFISDVQEYPDSEKRYTLQHFHNGIKVLHSIIYVFEQNNVVFELSDNLYTENYNSDIGNYNSEIKEINISDASFIIDNYKKGIDTDLYIIDEIENILYPSNLLIKTDTLRYINTIKFSQKNIKNSLDDNEIYLNVKNGSVFKIISPIKYLCNKDDGKTTYNGIQTIYTKYNGILSYILDNNGCDPNFSTSIHTIRKKNGRVHEYEDLVGDWTDDNVIPGVQSHWITHKVLEYFKLVHQRDDYTNLGGTLKVINYEDITESPCGKTSLEQAFWNANEKAIYIGSGKTSSAYDDMNTADIIAHEYTHAIIDFTAKLVYEGESGALNEGFADIFGIAFESWLYNYDMSDDRWKMGEKTGDVARDIKRPLTSGESIISATPYQCENKTVCKDIERTIGRPDTKNVGLWYTGPCDNGGVHTNSSVLTYWFYLLSTGGSGINGNNYQYNLKGIGFDKALEIAYEVLTKKLSPTSDFGEVKTQSLNIAQKYGLNSFEYKQVEEAWCAVGMGNNCTQKPDLIVQTATLSTTTINAGGSLNTSHTVKNQGIGNAGTSTTAIWLSKDQGFSSQEDINLNADVSVSALASGQTSSTYNKSITIPSGIASGQWYIMFGTDAIEIVNEGINENNNQKFVPITITNTSSCTPTTPTGVNGNSATQTSIYLYWNNIANVSYRVRYRKQGTSAWIEKTPTTNNTTLTNLLCGNTYEFGVQSFCSSNSSSYTSGTFTTASCGSTSAIDNCSDALLLNSNTFCYNIRTNVSNTTQSGLLIPKCNIFTSDFAYDVWFKFVAQANSHTITVDPEGSIYNNDYIDPVIAVYSSCYATNPIDCADDAGGGGGNCDITLYGLSIGSTYYIRVFDYNKVSFIPPTYSNFDICVTHTAPTCNAISNVSTSNYEQNSVAINWSNGSGLSNLELYYRSVGQSYYTSAGSVLGNTSKTLYGLSCGTAYEFYFISTCYSGAQYRRDGFFSTSNCPITCTAPFNLQLTTSTTQTTANLSWINGTNINNSYLKYRKVGTSTWSSSNILGSTTNTYPLSGLECNTQYECYVVSSCIGGGSVSTFTNYKFTTATCPIPCIVPLGSTESNISKTTATLSWNSVSSANSYSYRYRVRGSTSWITLNSLYSIVNLNGLSCGTTYDWEVSSQCLSGNSSYSSTRAFTTSMCVANPCNSITDINGCGTAYTQTFTGSNYGAWDANPCWFFLVKGSEKIYRFIAPTTGEYSFQVTSTNGGFVDYLWKTGSCTENDWICVDGIRSIGQYGEMSWTAGDTYYILLDNEYYDSINGIHSFNINCPIVCTTPLGSTESNITKTTANISWNRVPSTNNYSYRYRASGTSTWTTLNSFDTTVFIGGLNCGTVYQWEVRSQCSNGNSGYSNTKSFTTSACATNPCNNITVINGCGTSYTQNFTGTNIGAWDSNACWNSALGNEKIYKFIAPTTGVYSFQVSYSNGGYVDYLWKAGSCSENGWTCIDDISSVGQHGEMSWIAGNTYYILLDNEYYNSVNGIHSFNITCPLVCSTPVGVGESNTTQVSTTISWGGVSSANNYSYRYRVSGSNTWITQTSTSTSMFLSELNCSTLYEWEVRSQCSSGNSSYSNTRTFSTSACIASCLPPSSTSVAIGNPANDLDQFLVSFNWSSVNNADAYIFEFSPNGVDSWFAWQEIENNNVDINFMSPNRPAYLRVKSRCGINYSDYVYGNPYPLYTACSNPDIPIVLGSSSNEVSLSLPLESTNANPTYTTYAAYCSNLNLFVQQDGKLAISPFYQTKDQWGLLINVFSLNPATEYCFYFIAKNMQGDIRYDSSNIRCITTDIPTSIENLEALSSLNIIPNPNSGIFRIVGKTQVLEVIDVNIFNNLGYRVYANKINPISFLIDFEINLKNNGLASGFYFLQLSIDNNSIVKKIIIEYE